MPEDITPAPAAPHIDKLKEKQNLGYILPKFLQMAVDFFDFITDVVFPNILKVCGFFFQVLGIALLIVGTIACGVVICTTPLSLGLMALVIALISSGALPLAVTGASCYAFGKDLSQSKFSALYYLLMALPFTGYFGKWFPNATPPSPA